MFDAILVHPMFNLLALIYSVLPVHDFGISIIILTIIIRLLLWPLVSRQLHSQRALNELQPLMKKIRAESNGDRTLESQKIMELYKEKEINPFASILPLIIQLPIFFALYIVLKDATKAGEFAKIAYDPIRQLGPIAEIIKSGSGFHPTLLGLVDLTKAAPVVAALAALAQFIQTKQLQPKNQPAGDPQAQMMKTMVYVFPFITFFVGLSLPSALALYWLTSSSMAILQQTLVLRRDVEELEEGIVVDDSGVSKTKQKKRAKAAAKAGGTKS